MSDFVSSVACPACKRPGLYARDLSDTRGYANPYVYVCKCGAEWEEIPRQVVYLSGPMTGVDYAAAARKASEVQTRLTALGWRTYNPYGSGWHESSWVIAKELWLANDYYWLRQCTGIVLLPGWKASEGARLELDFARSIGLTVYEVVE